MTRQTRRDLTRSSVNARLMRASVANLATFKDTLMNLSGFLMEDKCRVINHYYVIGRNNKKRIFILVVSVNSL